MSKPTGNPVGRPKKPSKLRMIENQQVKKIPDKEPRPTSGLPICPRHLSKEARLIWNREGKRIAKTGLITLDDAPIFALFCTAYANLIRAEKEFQDEELIIISVSTGNPMANPLASEIYKLRDQVYKYGKLFGMSPQARAGLTVQPQEKTDAYDQWKQKKKDLRKTTDLTKKILRFLYPRGR